MNQQPTEENTTQKTDNILQDHSLKSHIHKNELHKASLKSTFISSIKNISFSNRDKISEVYIPFIADATIRDWSLQQGKALSLHKWQSEQAISLHFQKNHCMTDDALKWVVRLLKTNFSNLIHLDIVFVDCFATTWKGMEFLGEIVRHLPKLKEFKLEFCTFRGLTSKGVESLRYGLIRHLHDIESFSLGLEDENGLDDQDVELLLLSMSRYMKKLKSFHLSFDYSETVTSATLDLVARIISKKFKHLQTFKLSLVSHEDIEYENLDHISQTLSFIPNFTVRTKWP